MRIVVLDRDGVINHDSPHYIKAVDEWFPIQGSIEAIASLSSAGYKIAIATNQSGLGRELFDQFALEEIHGKLQQLVEDAGGLVDGIFYCPHLPTDNCSCRKPGVGLLQQIETEFDCSLSGVPFIGDSVKDLQAASAFGCVPVLVRTGNGAVTEKSLLHEGLEDVAIYDNLAAVVENMLAAKNVE